MRTSSNRLSTPSWRPPAPGRRAASATARSSSCRWRTASASAPANADRKPFEEKSETRNSKSEVIRICTMSLVPHRFLFRVAYPCRYGKDLPLLDDDRLLDLSAEYRIDNFAAMDEQRNFAEVCLAWNDNGVALQVDVKGKTKP